MGILRGVPMKTTALAALIVGILLAAGMERATAYSPVYISGLDTNQSSTLNAITKQSTYEYIYPIASDLDVDIRLAANQPDALNQLSPEPFHEFLSTIAFNNASFEVEAMDAYLAGLESGTSGSFYGSNSKIDVGGLTVTDPNVDAALQQSHSHMLAWNAAPYENGLLSDSTQDVMGGVDMKESKEMKTMAGPDYTDPWHFFVRGNVVLSQGFANQDVSHFDANSSAVVLGTDYRITPHLLVGITASFSHTDGTLDDVGSSATIDSYSPGIYAAYADKGWYANLIGDYLHNAYTEQRAIPFLGDTVTAAPEGNEGVADLDGGYNFHFGNLKAGPLLGVTYTHLTIDGYQEGGSSLGSLTVQEDQADSLRGRLGASARYPFSWHGMEFTPHLEAAWQHEFMDGDRGVLSSLSSGGGEFDVTTPSVGRDSAIVDAGVDVDINKTVGLFAEYSAQAGQDHYFGESVQAGVKIGF
jgi:outer membrane autotransporter protein